VSETSPLAKPNTGSLKTTVKVIGSVLVDRLGSGLFDGYRRLNIVKQHLLSLLSKPRCCCRRCPALRSGSPPLEEPTAQEIADGNVVGSTAVGHVNARR
jgi:hypothetical protein